jgi:hypothetical protein
MHDEKNKPLEVTLSLQFVLFLCLSYSGISNTPHSCLLWRLSDTFFEVSKYDAVKDLGILCSEKYALTPTFFKILVFLSTLRLSRVIN